MIKKLLITKDFNNKIKFGPSASIINELNDKQNDNEEILICTPHSKLHINGHGWIDITSKQILLLKKAKHSILAFRLEGNKVYYVNFFDLEKYLTQETMLNNKKEGTFKHYHTTGQLYYICSYIDDKKNGEYKEYYDDTYNNIGKLYEIVMYINDKKNGEYKNYYKTGELWIECSYINDEKHGKYTHYYPSGEIRYQCMYKNGIIIK